MTTEIKVDKEYLETQRRALLMQLDGVECALGIERTADKCSFAKERNYDYAKWKEKRLDNKA